ncbi:MAG: hypothetical protein [Siphoviridae sp. ctjeG17]|nr:MAG: hypothetical protein [Siphoviridae sp. ctjeG17]
MAKGIKPIWVIVIAVVAVIGTVWFTGGQGLSAAGGSDQATVTTAATTATSLAGCNTASTDLTYVGFDKLKPGTAVTVSSRVSVNGGTYVSGKVTDSPGNNLKVLLINGTTYHNALIETTQLPCRGTFDFQKGVDGYNGLKKNASLTVKVINDDGDATGTGSAGNTNNQTMSSGSSANMKLVLQGSADAATNDLRCVFEATEKAAVKDINVFGLGAVEVQGGVPRFYNQLNGSSELWVYDLNEVENAVSLEGSINVESESAVDASGTRMIIQCFSKEFFVDTDSTVKYGVENADGTQQSLLATNRSVYFS